MFDRATRLIESVDGRVHLLVRNVFAGDLFEYLPGHVGANMRESKRELVEGWPTCLVCVVEYERRRARQRALYGL